MILPDKIYNTLKWVVILVIPAAAVLYKTLAGIWGWAFADEIPNTLYAIEVFLGAILGFTGFNYENKKKEEAEKLEEARKLNGQD